MSDIELAVIVDAGSADADEVREQLTETILAFAAERGMEATVTPEDHWLEHELAKALRRFVNLAKSPSPLPGAGLVGDAQQALAKYDAIYGLEQDDEQTATDHFP